MLVLVLIITITTMNSSSFSQEENTPAQEKQQKNYNHHNLEHKILPISMNGLTFMRMSLLILIQMFLIHKLKILHSFIHLL
jgi:hypothetical protein